MDHMLDAPRYVIPFMKGTGMLTVFYANLIYDQYPDWKSARAAMTEEVFQGGYVYDHAKRNWWRMDMTPYPEEQIDPRMRAWILLVD